MSIASTISATANEEVYKYYFGEDRVKFYECRTAKNKGALYQSFQKSMSRRYIKQDPDIFDRIETATGVNEIITFKMCNRGSMSYGNTEGRDSYKGVDINVVGTAHQPDWIYKLFAYSLGLDFDVDAKLEPTWVEHNGYKFKFMTFDDEMLRNIQFWMIESEQEQAVGRARLLRCDCTVNHFSVLPLCQAVEKEFDI